MKEQITLTEALSYAKIPYEPTPLLPNERRIWTKAIVHVTKCDNSSNYAIAENAGNGEPNVIVDFGNSAKICRVNKIMPYMWMSTSDLPHFDTKEEVAEFLVNNGYSSELVNKLISTKGVDGLAKSKEEKLRDKEEIRKMIYAASARAEAAEEEYNKKIEEDYGNEY